MEEEPVTIDWRKVAEDRAAEIAILKERIRKRNKWRAEATRTLNHIARYGYASVVRNREAEARAYREEVHKLQEVVLQYMARFQVQPPHQSVLKRLFG